MRNSIFNEGLIEKETVLSSHILSADDDIASILKAIKENSKKEKVILENGVVKTTTEEGAEEKTTLSDHVVASDDDIASILKAIKENSKKEKVILENGVVKTTTEEGAEEKTTLSDHVVAGYWYNDYPNIYKFEKESLLEHQRNQGANNFTFSEGKTSDGRLYFVVNIRLKIDQILPNYKWHSFLMVYGHNFNNETSGSFGGQALKVYPADPDESYYYRNGEIFHHLLPRDESNRHYICRSLSKTNAQDINAYNSIEEILRWLLVFYIWKATGKDIDR